MDSLIVNIIIFLISALSTIIFGTYLAKYGDVIASITGLGRLFVGSILVALATSLPELSANISAVLLSPPNPSLALGNVIGANMTNMTMFALIALIFGGKAVLDQISNSQWYLASLAFIMTFVTLILGIINISLSVFNLGLSSLIILLLYLAGLRVIYSTKTEEKENNNEIYTISAKTAWSYFGLISLGVIISGYFLAFSVDNIAEISGIASSTLGIIAVSLVTTMPEASAYFASIKMKAADLGVAGLLGSCVFNISIIFYADIFYKGNLMSQFENAHITAGIFTSVMILLAMFIILFKDKLEKLISNSLLFSLIVLYALGIFFVTS